MKFESDGEALYYVVTDQDDAPREKRLDKLLEGSGWEPVPPGTRFKLHPGTIEQLLQHTQDPKLKEFLLHHKARSQNSPA